MRAFIHRALRVIEQALSARREYMTKEGEILYVARTTTLVSRRRNTSAILERRSPATKQPEKEDRTRLTRPELEELLRG